MIYTILRLPTGIFYANGVKLGQTLSISMGYVCFDENPEMTLDDMRKEAEKRMYKHKSDYYMKQGKDRRKT